MARKLSDVDALFLGEDEVERMFIGDTLVWNGDSVPELQTTLDAYFDEVSWSPPSTLGNQGTGSTSFDLPADGDGAANIVDWPALLPGDFAYNYKGVIDPAIGTEPYSEERLASQYQYRYTVPSGFAHTSITNEGTEGSAGDITVETTNAYNGTRSMYFPGVSNNYLSVPDSAALDLTTAIEIILRIAPFEVDNRLGNQRLVAKSGSARGYEVYIGYDTQHATLNFTRDGSTVAVASEKLPFLSEHIYWIRVTYTSGSTNFYWAPDNATEPSSWTQLGATQTNITGSIVANTDLLRVGTYNGSGDMFKGRLYRLIIRDAVSAGSTVLDIDIPTDTAAMTTDVTTTFTATSGQTVTLTKSGSPPNTVRINAAGTWFLQSDHRWGYASDLAELQTIENQLQVVWFRTTYTGVTPTRREIYPLLRAFTTAPYQDNSWTIAYDPFQGEMKFTFESSSQTSDDIWLSGSGPVTGSLEQVYALAIIYVNGSTRAWFVRYNPPTETFVYESFGGSGTPQTYFVSGDIINSATNGLQMWQGMAGFAINEVGIVNFPDVINAAMSAGWDTNDDLVIRPYVENAVRVVALGLEADYTVGDFWRASDDGVMAIASTAVDEGDLFAVSSADPVQFQQIKLNHPSRRRGMYRPSNVTFGPPASPFFVDASDDLFLWAVLSSNQTTEFEYVSYGYDSTTDAFIDVELGRDTFSSDVWVYFELDDDDGNIGWVQYRGDTADEPVHTVWDRGFSEPTLVGFSVDRANGIFQGYLYDDSHGLTVLENQSSDTLTGDVSMDSFWFFGPESEEAYANTMFYGGGWVSGIGVIPDEEGVVEYWQRAVYGYPQA